MVVLDSPYKTANQFVGFVKEIPGTKHDPFIQWCFTTVDGYDGETPDEVAWCSVFVNAIAWIHRLDRSRSAAARSWLKLPHAIELAAAAPGFDVVILKRGAGAQPGPDVLKAPGHVGFFAGLVNGRVLVLGGNQSNGVTIAPFDASLVLGIRRL